jgi:hypothetical protein
MVWQVRFEPPVSVSVHLGPTSVDFFFGGFGGGERGAILWCCHIGDRPQGDLAMFGYRPAMKVKFY